MINGVKKETPPHKSANYAFIDSQNLNLGVQRMGWKLDWRKFRQMLEKKYGVTHAYLFVGYMEEYESLYEQMHELGYLVALKPTVDMNRQDDQKTESAAKKPTDDKEEKRATKGNVDTDLVLYAMKELPSYNKAIIVSGDGDFYSLIEYLISKNKLLHIMTPNWKYSSLLKGFDDYIVRIDQMRGQLSYRDRHGKAQTPKQ
jgi:uncharacterized LabA/DUF88 family protein